MLLDDIGDLPASCRSSCCACCRRNRCVRTGATRRAGQRPVFSAANHDPHQLAASGQLREDLFYRLNVVQIEMPPLSRRREDIPLLVAHFLAQLASETGTRKIYAPEALELLATADWPGNVRQLQNVVRQTFSVAQTPIIPVELVQQSLGGGPAGCPPSTRRATNSRAATCRRSCRSRAETSARRRASPSATAPTSTSCWAGTRWCRRTSSSADQQPRTRAISTVTATASRTVGIQASRKGSSQRQSSRLPPCAEE